MEEEKNGNLRRSSEVGRNGKEHKKWKNKKTRAEQ